MLTLSKKYPYKRAFITGAASGLGLALCKALAAEGWVLGMADLDFDGLQKAAAEVESLGGQALVFELDVADKEAYREVANEYLRMVSGIDLLINNAGVGDGGFFEEYSLENWEWLLSINLMGVIHGCHFFLPMLKQQGKGCIVNTASAAAIACAPQMAAYNTSKAAVVAISESLYSELAPFGIAVSVLQPWFFQTNIAQAARGGAAIKKTTQKLIDASGLSAEKVADEVLRRVGKGELYVILPAKARKMWWLKRLAPTWFRKQMSALAKKVMPQN